MQEKFKLDTSKIDARQEVERCTYLIVCEHQLLAALRKHGISEEE